MSAREESDADRVWPRLLTPQEARRMREYHLALARENARIDGDEHADDCASAEPMLATFILPGD